MCYAFILLAMNVLRLVDVRIQSRQKTATVYFELRSKLSIGQPVRKARKRTARSRSWSCTPIPAMATTLCAARSPSLGGGPHVARRYPSGISAVEGVIYLTRI